MPKINCLPDMKVVEADGAQTMLDALLTAGIPHTHACGGQAYCSTCRVMILDGIAHCSPPTAAERALTQRLQFPVHVRLACQTQISGNVNIRRLVLDDEDLDLVDSQLSDGATGVEKSVVLLLAVIRGITNFDEVNFPYDLMYIMSRYFHRIHRIVAAYGGKIDNYMGRQILAIFSPQATASDCVERSVWAGLEMQQSITELNQFLQKLSYQPLQLSVGIHYGPVVMVPVDTAKPNLLLPIGDGVNLVSRVEAANHTIGSNLLISESVLQFVQDKAEIDRGTVLPIGSRAQELGVFELIGIKGDRPAKITQEETTSSLGQRFKSFMQKFGWGKSK